MADENVKKSSGSIGSKAAEESYKMAKMIKQGSKELDRQMNSRNSRGTR